MSHRPSVGARTGPADPPNGAPGAAGGGGGGAGGAGPPATPRGPSPPPGAPARARPRPAELAARRGRLAAAAEVGTALGLAPLLARTPAGMAQLVGETGWQLSNQE